MVFFSKIFFFGISLIVFFLHSAYTEYDLSEIYRLSGFCVVGNFAGIFFCIFFIYMVSALITTVMHTI